MKYTWLLFDADDTLFDYPLAESRALQRTFEQVGLDFNQDSLACYHRHNRQVWEEFERGEVSALELRTRRFRLLFDELGVPLDPELVSPLYLRNLSLGVDLLPGAQETLAALRGRYRMALVTNGLADVQRPRLERSALHGCFEQVFISEEIGAVKPDAAFFEAVFHRLGRPSKREVLIIGDSLSSDMQGGVNYGLDTCWYNPLGKTASLPVTYEITRLQELTGFL